MALSKPERRRLLLMVVCAAPVFAVGFMGTSRELFQVFAHWCRLPAREWAIQSAFPLLALLFYFSFNRRAITPPREPLPKSRLWLMSALPILIAWLYGAFHNPYPFWAAIDPIELLWWNVFCIPIGEEVIFRGWFYTLFDKLFGGKLFTLSNPLPAGVVASALAFSIWHLQNLTSQNLAWVLFQVGYTFGVGIWLGYLRWQSGNLGSAVLAHAILNFASLCF